MPVISKIYERLVYNQLYAYLQSENLIYELQSGFRERYSTDSALIYLTDMIRNNMDSGNLAGQIQLDLQKAFDTVNHDILLLKLSAAGISDSATSWLRSYLTGRGQFVDLSGVSSPTL